MLELRKGGPLEIRHLAPRRLTQLVLISLRHGISLGEPAFLDQNSQNLGTGITQEALRSFKARGPRPDCQMGAGGTGGARRSRAPGWPGTGRGAARRRAGEGGGFRSCLPPVRSPAPGGSAPRSRAESPSQDIELQAARRGHHQVAISASMQACLDNVAPDALTGATPEGARCAWPRLLPLLEGCGGQVSGRSPPGGGARHLQAGPEACGCRGGGEVLAVEHPAHPVDILAWLEDGVDA